MIESNIVHILDIRSNLEYVFAQVSNAAEVQRKVLAESPKGNEAFNRGMLDVLDLTSVSVAAGMQVLPATTETVDELIAADERDLGYAHQGDLALALFASSLRQHVLPIYPTPYGYTEKEKEDYQFGMRKAFSCWSVEHSTLSSPLFPGAMGYSQWLQYRKQLELSS